MDNQNTGYLNNVVNNIGERVSFVREPAIFVTSTRQYIYIWYI